MDILQSILFNLGDGDVLSVTIGIHWTAVIARVEGIRRCGMCATLTGKHAHTGKPPVPNAGELEKLTAHQLAEFAVQSKPTLVSIGIAAINALLPRSPASWREANAEEVITYHGKDKQVALVGHFPFVPHLRSQVRKLSVLELDPQEGDLPASKAPEVIPEADVVAITGMALVNRTLDKLLSFCSPQAIVMVLGPSTPLSPIMLEHGVDVISGSIVEAIDPVVKVISQGGTFPQVHRAGVRLVNIYQNEQLEPL